MSSTSDCNLILEIELLQMSLVKIILEWALNPIGLKSLQEARDAEREGDHIKAEAAIGIMPPQVWVYQKVECARKDHPLRFWGECGLADTMNSESQLPELYENKFLLF